MYKIKVTKEFKNGNLKGFVNSFVIEVENLDSWFIGRKFVSIEGTKMIITDIEILNQ